MKKIKRIKTSGPQIKMLELKENNFVNSQMQLNLEKRVKTQTDIPSPGSGIQLFFMKTKRLKLFPKSKSTLRQKNISQQTNRINFPSSFQILKKQIQNLENDQILHKNNYQKENKNIQTQFESTATYNNYFVNSQFLSTKKIALFLKRKLNIKKCHKNKKYHLMLKPDKKIQLNIQKVDNLTIKSSFVSLKLANQQILAKSCMKKKQTPQIIKKYYQSANHKHQRSFSKINFNATASQIKGKAFNFEFYDKIKLQSRQKKRRSLSVVNKRQETLNQQTENEQILFMCL